jgi:hypothetical protein
VTPTENNLPAQPLMGTGERRVGSTQVEVKPSVTRILPNPVTHAELHAALRSLG